MDRENTNLLIITIVFIAVMGGGALIIFGGYFVSQSAISTVPAAPQTFGRTFAFSQQPNNPYQQFSDTIADLTLQLEEDPENVKAYRERGLAHVQLGDLTSAMDDYNAALEIDSDDYLTLEARANLYYSQEQTKQALKDYSAVIKLGHGNADVYGFRAAIRGSNGDYEGSVEDYTIAIELSGEHFHYLNGRGWANSQAGHLQDSIDDYTSVLNKYPQWADIYHYRAFVWNELYNYEEAIRDIKEAIRYEPAASDIIADYAWILHETGKFEEALVQADLAVGYQNIAQSKGSLIRARIKRDLGDYEGAYSDLNEALAYDRDDTNLLNERAWLSWAKGDLTRAQVDFKRLVDLDPSSFYRHMGLGVNQYHQGNFSQAAEYLGLAVTFKEDDIDYAQLYRWLSHARANDQKLADELLREFARTRKPHITDVDTDDWPGKLVAFLLGDLSSTDLLEIAQSDKPLQTAQRKCEACFYIGSASLIQGNNKQAAEYFKQSMQTKVTTFYEYHSATTELRALGELE